MIGTFLDLALRTARPLQGTQSTYTATACPTTPGFDMRTVSVRPRLVSTSALLLCLTLSTQASAQTTLGPFTFSPTNTSGVLLGQAKLNGAFASANDVVGARDSNGNVAGAAMIIVSGGISYIRLPIYGDDPTTVAADEGMNGSESFTLELFDASENKIIPLGQSLSNWSNSNGAPMPGFNDPNRIFAFVVPAGNTPPTADPKNLSTPEDSGIQVGLSGSDPDPGDIITFSVATAPTNGTLGPISGNQVTYTPKSNFAGIDTFTYRAEDGKSSSDVATVTISVTAVNDPPVAVDDAATTPEDTPISIPVLANDTDVDSETLTVSAVPGAVNGTATINAGGTEVTFTPAANFSGSGSFTYTVTDGSGGTDTGLVTITVAAVNDPPVAVDDAASTPEDTPVSIPVTVNDTDIDGGPRTVVATANSVNGTVSIDPSNTSVTFTPAANFSGIGRFSYTTNDGNGGTDTGDVIVTVTPVNDLPVTIGDRVTVAGGSSISIAVTSNDSDVDGDPLTVTAVTQGGKGTTSVETGGTILYSAQASATGEDQFTYTISDGHGGSATATVVVEIGSTSDILWAEGFETTTAGARPSGWRVINPGSSLSVLTSTSKEGGKSLFIAGVPFGGANIDVQLPSMTADIYRLSFWMRTDQTAWTGTDGETNLQIDLGGVSAVLGIVRVGSTDKLRVLTVLGGTTQHSEVPLPTGLQVGSWNQYEIILNTSAGAVSYLVNGNTVLQGNAGTTTQNNRVMVSSGAAGGGAGRPSAYYDQMSLRREESGGGPDESPVVLDFESGLDGWVVTVERTAQHAIVSSPVHGGNAALKAGPSSCSANCYGPSEQGIRLSRSFGGQHVASIDFWVLEEATTSSNFGQSGWVIVDGEQLPGSAFNPHTTHGKNTWVRISAPVNQPVTELTIYVRDITSSGYIVIDDITVVLGAPAGPTAAAQSVTTAEDTPVAITLVASGSTQLTYSIAAPPSNGSLSSLSGNTVTYTPSRDYHGSDSFTFKANDGTTDSNVAVVSLSVTATNDAPIAQPDIASTPAASPVTIPVLSNDSDVDGDQLTLQSVSNGTFGSAVKSGDQIVYTPAAGTTGDDTFSYSITDGNGGFATTTVTVSVGSPKAIVFATDRAGSYDVWVMDSFGAGAMNLSSIAHDPTGTWMDLSPAWSPDGSRIAFISNKRGRPKVWVMDADGTNPFEVNPDSDYLESDPEWSRDGKRILYVQNVQYTLPAPGSCGSCPHEEIFVVDLASRARTRLTTNTYRNLEPIESPDGSEIAYLHAERSNDCCNATDIWIMSSDGSNQRKLIATPGQYDWLFDWSPSGMISFTTDVSPGNSEMFILDMTQAPALQTRLSDNSYPDSPLAFSPDGSMLLYSSRESGKLDLWIRSLEGSTKRQLTADGAGTGGGDWRSCLSAPALRPPVAVDDAATTNAGTAIVIGVLANDSDADNDILTVTAVTQPPNGTALLNASGTVTYTPKEGFFGVDAFDYTVSDGNATDIGSVLITVQSTDGGQTVFAAVVTMTDFGRNAVQVTLGTAHGATNGFNDGLDEAAPPPPPAGSLDFRACVLGGECFFKDFRAPVEAGSITWRLEFEASGGLPVTLSWAGVPTKGSMRLWDGLNGTILDVDMASRQSVQVALDLPLTVTWSAADELEVAVPFLSGWNLRGLPFLAGGRTYKDLFPAVVQNTLYRYDASYLAPTDGLMEPGFGYWARTTDAAEYRVRGTRVKRIERALKLGWNLIAGPGCELPLSSVGDSGGIILANTLYRYDNRYVAPNPPSLSPGVGYWLRSSANGMIVMDCASAVAGKSADIADRYAGPLRGFGRIVVSDGANSSVLYWGGDLDRGVDADEYSLPPTSPGGGFDVRFDSGRFIAQSNETTDGAAVTITSESGQIDVSAQGGPATAGGWSLQAMDHTGRWSTVASSAAPRVTLHGDLHRLRLVAGSTRSVADGVPGTIRLHAAYPNPFNPTTTLAFDLPAAMHARLSIFDVLGREVMAVADGPFDVGRHEIRFEAGGLGTGVYTYVLRTAAGVRTRQFVLKK